MNDPETTTPTPAAVRRRRHTIPLSARPAPVQAEIKRLRREARNFRLRLRETEARLADAQATIAGLRLDNSDLVAGIVPQGV